MPDFAKDKIAFAIGLLAVLFTLTPLVDAHGRVGFHLWGLAIQLQHLYYVVAIALGLAVYAYGIQFVTDRGLRPARAAGEFFYALALVAPGLYGALYVIAKLSDGIAAISRSPALVALIRSGLSIASGIVAAIIAYSFRRVLERKDRQLEETRRKSVQFNALKRGKELFEAGHYDLAVVEAFKAIAVAARELPGAPGKGPAPRDWLAPLMAQVPVELRPAIDRVRQLRNQAAHTTEPVSKETAREALLAANKVLAILSGVHSDQCPQCGHPALVEEEGSDHGFSWTRRRCQKCGYLDLG